jgi:signal transduction histidine kinase
LLECYRTGNYLGEIKPQKTDITALLQDTIDGFMDNERIKFVKPQNPVYASVDSEKIETVFRNILDNALKYSSEAVEVSINTDQQGECLITFRDRGQGINGKELNYIFEPFYRIADLSRSKSRRFARLICKRSSTLTTAKLRLKASG